MNRDLLDGLPSFLAYPYSRYLEDPKRAPRLLFHILENLLHYVECLLRAQGNDKSDLGRPSGLGIRTERILLLSKRLREAERQPLIQFVREDRRDEDLDLLVSSRNRWSHPQEADADKSVFENSDEFDAAIRRLLQKVTPVTVHVIRNSPAEGPRSFALKGLRGLFDAPTSSLGQTMHEPEDGALAAHAAGIPPVILDPFLVFSVGSLGENRVKMLARVRGGTTRYVDALDLLDFRA